MSSHGRVCLYQHQLACDCDGDRAHSYMGRASSSPQPPPTRYEFNMFKNLARRCAKINTSLDHAFSGFLLYLMDVRGAANSDATGRCHWASRRSLNDAVRVGHVHKSDAVRCACEQDVCERE